MPGYLFDGFTTCLFGMSRLPNQPGTVLRVTLFSFDAALTPFFERAQRVKEASHASFDAAYRCHVSNRRRASLRSRSERSGAIAFARSLQPLVGYPGPEARRGSGRHRAGGESQAGLSTADSR